MERIAMIREMLELQDKLNILTNGDDWRNGVTKEGRKIDWIRCIYMEAAELIDSFNWKHWKNINEKDDIDNAKVELVDIWHFIMSQLIMFNGVDRSAILIDRFGRPDIKIIEKYDTINVIELFLSFTVCTRGREVRFLISHFFNIMDKLNVSLDELYEKYLIKNTLNIFRQDHGYKDGTYVKIINGSEDNVIMFNLAEKLKQEDKLTYDNLYDGFEKIYEEAVNEQKSKIKENSKDDAGNSGNRNNKAKTSKTTGKTK